ncbi:MAG: hypothetical protein CMG07_00855, partial [Candidatus Marinimicrobia bacterium]|nr:hypothetical protein [Candidatus Neomarinimicrobiota bacterium]
MYFLKRILFTSFFFSIIISQQCDYEVCLEFDQNNLNYFSEYSIAGFQFSHDNCVQSASGGDAAQNGFTFSLNSTTVLAFSFSGTVIPSGEGTLVQLNGNVTNDCLSDFIFSNSEGNSLSVGWFEDNDSDENYYNLDLLETGSFQLVIFQSTISSLDIGDEIGVFDSNGILETCDPLAGCNEPIQGEVLVGTGVWTGSQLEIAAIESTDLSDFGGPILNGAIDGNPLLIKVWKAAIQNEFEAIPTWSSGNGNFGDLLLSATNLEILTSEISGCIDSDACNFDPNATEDDGSCLYPEEYYDC